MKKVLSPYIRIRKSGIHNTGVFARKNIRKGTRIIEYLGPKISKEQAEKRADEIWEQHKNDSSNGAVYIFELNRTYDIDGSVDYNTAKYINHSCEPNCETEISGNRVWIIAMKDIKEGEELTYDYGYAIEDFEDHPCNCGSPKCMGYIVSQDYWPELRKLIKKQLKK